MLKTVGLMPKRPDFTLAAFRTYYETQHSELALSLPTHFRFAKYVRNHIVSAPSDVYFHCISEFWFKNTDDVANARAFLQSPAGEVVKHDERQFLNEPRQSSFGSTEFLLAGPPRGIEPPGARRVFWPLLLDDTDPDRDELVDELSRRLSEAGLAGTRWALDIKGDPVYREVPFDAMVSVWIDPAHPAPSEVDSLLSGIGRPLWRIETEATETPRDRLPNAA